MKILFLYFLFCKFLLLNQVQNKAITGNNEALKILKDIFKKENAIKQEIININKDILKLVDLKRKSTLNDIVTATFILPTSFNIPPWITDHVSRKTDDISIKTSTTKSTSASKTIIKKNTTKTTSIFYYIIYI
jgi:hypothetical protein